MTSKLQLIVSTIFLSLTLSAQVPNYVPTSSLVAWYSFNGNANDLSGNGNNGTPMNGVSLTTDRFNIANSAYSFDGLNDYIICNASSTLQSQNKTISVWVYEIQDFGQNEFLCLGSTSSTSWGCIASNNNLCLNFGRGCNGTPSQVLNSPMNYSNWYHFVYVSTGVGGQTNIYVNGQFYGTETNAVSVGACSTSSLYFGVDIFSLPEYFNGKLDDIGIWNRALTQCEISQLYNSGNSPINATSSSSLICAGQSVTLSATGANTYTWNPGALIGASISVSPTVSTTYTVAGTNSLTGCTNSTVYTQSVSALPQVSATTSSSLICYGETATLTALGANSYTWNPGALNGTIILVSPTVTTTYTLSGTNTLTGCANNTLVTQNVSPCTGISNNSLGRNSGLTIFPNPSNGEFTILTATDITLTITNELGQVVKTISLTSKNNHQVLLTSLASGLYFVSGNNGSTSVKEIIVVNK